MNKSDSEIEEIIKGFFKQDRKEQKEKKPIIGIKKKLIKSQKAGVLTSPPIEYKQKHLK